MSTIKDAVYDYYKDRGLYNADVILESNDIKEQAGLNGGNITSLGYM